MGSHISPNISGNIIIKTLNTSFYPNLVLKMKTMVMYSYLFTIGVVMIKTLASPISEAQSQKAMQYVGIGCCDSEIDVQLIPLSDINRVTCEILCATSKNCKGYSYGPRVIYGKATNGVFDILHAKRLHKRGFVKEKHGNHSNHIYK